MPLPRRLFRVDRGNESPMSGGGDIDQRLKLCDAVDWRSVRRGGDDADRGGCSETGNNGAAIGHAFGGCQNWGVTASDSPIEKISSGV